MYPSSRGAQIFKKYRSHLKILGTSTQNLVTTATWNHGFVHHCLKARPHRA